MAHLLKINRVYYSDLRMGGKRIRRALSTDKRIAEEKLAEMKDLQVAIRHGHAPKDVSWEAFRYRYMEYSRTKQPQTHYIDKNTFAKLEREFPNLKLANIFNPDFMDRWLTRQRDLNYAPSTVRREYKALKAAARKAVEWRYLKEAHFPDTRKRLRVAKGSLRFYTAQELKKLNRVCRGAWKTVLHLGFYAGLRRGEIRSLRWANVDLIRNRIHIESNDEWAPKDFERRWIPMAATLRDYLRSLPKGSEFVLGHDGWIPALSGMTECFKRLVRKAGLRKGGLHALRHSFGSHLAMAGVPLPAIKEMMGHASIETTEIYLHLTPEVIEDSVKRLPII